MNLVYGIKNSLPTTSKDRRLAVEFLIKSLEKDLKELKTNTVLKIEITYTTKD